MIHLLTGIFRMLFNAQPCRRHALECGALFSGEDDCRPGEAQDLGETGRTPSPALIAGFPDVGLADLLLGMDAGIARFSSSMDALIAGSDGEETLVMHEIVGERDDAYALVDVKAVAGGGDSAAAPGISGPRSRSGSSTDSNRARSPTRLAARRCRYHGCYAAAPSGRTPRWTPPRSYAKSLRSRS